MQMTVDKARRGYRPAAVNAALSGKSLGDLGRLADLDDLAFIHGDRRVADDAASGVDGNKPVDIRYQQIDRLHPWLRLLVFADIGEFIGDLQFDENVIVGRVFAQHGAVADALGDEQHVAGMHDLDAHLGLPLQRALDAEEIRHLPHP